jgi:hypothetical protein
VEQPTYSGQGGYRGPRPDLAARNRGPGPRLYEDREWIRVRYLDLGMTLREIAADADCGLRTIARWMTIHGIETSTSIEQRRRRGTLPTGKDHPRWRGGRSTPHCQCGRRMAKEAKTCIHCRDYWGERNPRWLGDTVGYAQFHWRLQQLRGAARAHPCITCEAPAAHWAYDHRDPEERYEHGEGYFSLDPGHYQAMCARCHKRLDLDQLRRRRANGQEVPTLGQRV